MYKSKAYKLSVTGSLDKIIAGVKRAPDGLEFVESIVRAADKAERGLYGVMQELEGQAKEVDRAQRKLKSELDQLEREKERLRKEFDSLSAKRKRLYGNMDIASAKSSDEKALDKKLANVSSLMNTKVREKRKLSPYIKELQWAEGYIKESIRRVRSLINKVASARNINA